MIDRGALRCLALSLTLSACESNTLSNEPLGPADSGTPTGSSGTKRDASTTTRGDARTPTPSEDDAGEESVPGSDAGASPEDDASTAEDSGAVAPTKSLIAGSAASASCSSYGMASGDMCAGYFCGTSAEQLAKEYVSTSANCATTAEKICDGKLTRTVAKCARDTKSNPLNALDSDEQIRAKVQDCVYKDPDNAELEESCVGCFLDAAQCASDHCLTQCLSGDNANCDKCRLDNECDQPAVVCAGFPTPF